MTELTESIELASPDVFNVANALGRPRAAEKFTFRGSFCLDGGERCAEPV